MKKILIIIFSILSLQQLTAQSGSERGAQSQYQEIFELKNDSLVLVKAIYQEYDKKNNIILEIYFNADSTIRSKETFRYSRKGLEVESIKYKGANQFVSKTLTTYDKFNERRDIVIVDSMGVIIEKTHVAYDTFGRKFEEKTTTATNELIKRVVFNYDSRGSLVEKITYDETDKIIALKKYKYTY